MSLSAIGRVGLLVRLRGPLRSTAHRAVLRKDSSTFQSQYAVESLYPGSTLRDRFSTGQAVADSAQSSSGGGGGDLSFSGHIPVKELQISYTLSSGPGGQHANKTATKVDIRFHFDSASWLSAEVKSAVRPRLSSQLTKDGFLVVRSDRTRSQLLNQADAMRKLREAIWGALAALPKVQELSKEEKEIKRKRLLRVARERVREKRNKSQVKGQRKGGAEWTG